jgi:hypothetical protein
MLKHRHEPFIDTPYRGAGAEVPVTD